jgi:hydrogenase maturation protease
MNASRMDKRRLSELLKKNPLCFGIGNSGRGDDGLGWAFLERLENWPEFNGRCEFRYQLQVEDADLAAQFEHVLFIDAYKGEDLPEGVLFKECQPALAFAFSTHEIAPESILYLASDLFGKQPKAYLLGMAGYKWELEIGLSEEGRGNLEKAWSLR